MALYHRATITPSKAELIAAWAPSQPWCPPGSDVEVIGAYRFDDPEGRVGMEAHIVTVGDAILHVPLTYRDEPDAANAAALIGEMEHSALGTRWVYDGLRDPVFIVMFAAAAMTGQGEALGMVVNDGQWFIAPTHVRLHGGGWGQERVSVDGFTAVATDDEKCVYRNERFELAAFRRLHAGPKPAIGLTATWDGHANPIVLAAVQELTGTG